jgi:23S rRNA (uracil1939-C5)-methyltransferase
MERYDSAVITGLSPKGFFTGRGSAGRDLLCLYTDIGEETYGPWFRKKRKSYHRTETLLSHPSPYRIDPACPFFTQCGGCDLQHLTLEREHEIKTLLATALLGSIPERLIPSPLTFGYRNNMEFTFSPQAMGLHRKLSKRLLDIPSCPLAHPDIETAMSRFRLSRSHDEGEVRFLTTDEGLLTRVYPKYVSKETDTARLVFGSKNIAAMTYFVSPDTFFQSNDAVVAPWLDTITGWACEAASPKSSVLDLYCGSGTIALKLAAHFRHVTGIENNPLSLFLFEKGIRANGFSSAELTLIQGDLMTHDLKRLRPDLLVVNPPRGGLSPLVRSFIREKRFPYIIYSSCNVASFARDITDMDSYQLEKYLIVNMFPRTFHFEVVGRLKLKEE